MQLSEPTPKSKNRMSILFMIGILTAASGAVAVDQTRVFMMGSSSSSIDLSTAAQLVPTDPRVLSPEDKQAAKVAWRYFEQNTRAETGLVDSVATFPSTTLWDQGSYILALSAAEALGIIERQEYDTRVKQLLASMKALPLFDGKLPNKAYNTETMQMVDYDNSVSEQGVGWSALDLGRLLSGLRVLERHAPEYGGQIRNLLAGWDLDALSEDGELVGAAWENGEIAHPQEGRIGYEQYAARAAALWGMDVVRAMSTDRILKWETVSGVRIPIDLRSHISHGTITPTLSEPYFLQGLELGFDSETQRLAAQVYLAQEARFEQGGPLTMVSEDHINQPPYFLYSSVHSNGSPWAVVTEKGEFHNDKRSLSLKAVYAWDALYDRPYTQNLRQHLDHLARPGGWAAGQYETSGAPNDVLTLNTNAVVLEAIHYIAYGPLWQLR